MAPRFSLLLPILSLFLFSLSVNARPGVQFHPCNTFVVSAYSFSIHPLNPKPNFRRPEVVAVFDDLRLESGVLRHRHRRFFLPDSRFVPHHHERPEDFLHSEKLELPFSLGFSSFKERTKDILNVVASLLLGAACGALTAGTMYLIWSLFNHPNGSYRSLDDFSSDDDDDNDDDDIFNPKKGGYVAIPATPAAKIVDSETPSVDPAAAPVKEST